MSTSSTDRTHEGGVILLVGPRGVGKTTLGNALSARGLGRSTALDEALATDEALIVETTGAGSGALRSVEQIRRARPVFSIRLRAPQSTCAERIRERMTHQGDDDDALTETYAATEAFDDRWGRAYDLDLHLYQYDPAFPPVSVLADQLEAAIAQSWFGGRAPTWTGQLTHDGEPRLVRLWESTDVEVAPAEFHGHLYVEGHPDLDPPRPCPGGTPLQATHLTWARLRAVELKLDGVVSGAWPPPRPGS